MTPVLRFFGYWQVSGWHSCHFSRQLPLLRVGASPLPCTLLSLRLPFMNIKSLTQHTNRLPVPDCPTFWLPLEMHSL